MRTQIVCTMRAELCSCFVLVVSVCVCIPSLPTFLCHFLVVLPRCMQSLRLRAPLIRKMFSCFRRLTHKRQQRRTNIIQLRICNTRDDVFLLRGHSFCDSLAALFVNSSVNGTYSVGSASASSSLYVCPLAKKIKAKSKSSGAPICAIPSKRGHRTGRACF